MNKWGKKIRDIPVTVDQILGAIQYSDPRERMTYLGHYCPDYWRLTKQRMGDYVGISRVTASTIFNQLKREGYFDGNDIISKTD